MAEPDMTAKAGRVKASIKQAVGKLTGDPAVEAQGVQENPGQRSRKLDDEKVKSNKVNNK